jgi:hypothetical protein
MHDNDTAACTQERQRIAHAEEGHTYDHYIYFDRAACIGRENIRNREV